ncbi:MAG: putative secreted hydrolase [Paraglaciecola sp.]|jgi:predicted secreted hydrolase
MPDFLNKWRISCSAILTIFYLSACSPNDNSDNKVIAYSEQNLFAGLSQQTLNQAQVLPGYIFDFPADHASHPDFAIEWWYLTANLLDESGKKYAMQWTLFRFRNQGNVTPWANDQQFMAHASLHSTEHSWFEERFARGGVGNAAVSTQPFKVNLDNWQWLSTDSNPFPSTLSFSIDANVQVTLQLQADKDIVLHGENGFSRKLRDSQQVSYYYSQPHIDVSGLLEISGKTLQVSGLAWFDHEWSSQYLDENSQGWDWFSMHLDNGDKLMLFNMRHKNNGNFWSGTLVKKSGAKIHLSQKQIQAKVIKNHTVQGRSLPLDWSIQLQEHGIDIQLKPMKIEQWNPGMFAYYEGGTEITGSHHGVGFIELTGY